MGVAGDVGIDVPADISEHQYAVVVVVGSPYRLRTPLNDLGGRHYLLGPRLDQEVQSGDGERQCHRVKRIAIRGPGRVHLRTYIRLKR